MNARSASVTEINPTLKNPVPQSLTEAQIDEIIFPDLSQDEFTLGDKSYRIRVLNFRWEKLFRRQYAPITAEELKPFERLILLMASDIIEPMGGDLGLARSIANSEVEVDAYLTNCIIIICLSQDPEHVAANKNGDELPLDKQKQIEKRYRTIIENLDEVPGGGGPRHYLRSIVRIQAEKQKLVQDLGESLMARFAETGVLLGAKEQFDSLKQGFTRSVQKVLEKAGKTEKMLASLSSPSTESGSAKPLTPKNNESESESKNAPVEEATQADATEKISDNKTTFEESTLPTAATSDLESKSETLPA